MTSPNPRTYRLDLPFYRPPEALTGNAREGHWAPRSKATNEVRTAVAWLGRQAGIPPSRHLTVELVWAPGDRRKRDADNLWPMLKACCDGLARGPRKPSARAAPWVGLDLVPDDTPRWMRKLPPRIAGPDETDEIGVWLLVTAIPVEASESDSGLTRSAPLDRIGPSGRQRGCEGPAMASPERVVRPAGPEWEG